MLSTRQLTLTTAIVVALSAGNVFAQSANNLPIITQYGVGAVARYNQTGTNQNLLIYQDQVSSGIDAGRVYTDPLTGESTNNNLYGRIYQSGNGSAAGANSIGSIKQAGNKQVALISQAGVGNKGIIDQANNANRDNLVSVVQTNDNNEATLIQGATSNTSAEVSQNGVGNKVFGQQYGTSLLNRTTQVGNSNVGTFYQTGSYGVALLNQVGNGNKADFVQSNAKNMAAVTQTGNNHTAVIKQYSVSARDVNSTTPDVSITQSGANNSATAYQDSNTTGNKTNIVQNGGVVGILTGSITGPIVLDASQPNSAIVEQNGVAKNNTATVSQDGAGLQAEIQQQSNGSTAAIYQSLARDTNGQPTTKSYKNKASIFQGALAGGSTASILQEGGFNGYDAANPSAAPKVYINQFAAGNTAYLTQKGDYNHAGIQQSSAGNTSNIYQTKNFNNASVLQGSGSGNEAVVNQFSNIDSNTTTSAGNDAKIQQYGNANKVAIGMNNKNNKLIIGQSGNENSLGHIGYGSTTTAGTLVNYQTGEKNTIGLNVSNVSADTNASIAQNGISNTAQFTGASSVLTSIISQNGNNNYASHGTDLYNDISKESSMITIQNGNENSSTNSLRIAPKNYITVEQIGNKNTSAVNNFNISSAKLLVRQKGNGNKSDITGRAASNISGIFDGAGGVSQEGDNNTAAIYVGTTTNNQANIVQKGNNNTARQDFYGSDNVMYISQNGDFNTANQRIEGANNNLSIIQQGNNNTGNINWVGNNNNLKINQTGNGLNYNLTGNNSGQVIAITQNN